MEIHAKNDGGKVEGKELSFIDIYVNCLAIVSFNDELYAYIFTSCVSIYGMLSYPLFLWIFGRVL